MQRLIFLLILFSLGFSNNILPGYKEFRFFMSDEDVKKIVSDPKKGYLASQEALVEEILDIYHHVEVKDKFVYFDNEERRYYNFQFTNTSGIYAIKNYDYDAIVHLTEQHSLDYKIITAPAGLGKEDPDWSHSFIFYQYQNENRNTEYKLFAIVLDFKGENNIGSFNFVPEYFFKRLIKKVNKVFGTPQLQRKQLIDSKTEKHYITYEHVYHEAGLFNIHTQVNVSYVVFKRNKANFKITYITGEYIKDVKDKFTRFIFKDKNKTPIPKLQ